MLIEGLSFVIDNFNKNFNNISCYVVFIKVCGINIILVYKSEINNIFWGFILFDIFLSFWVVNKFVNFDVENVNLVIKVIFDVKFVSCDIYMVIIGFIEYKVSWVMNVVIKIDVIKNLFGNIFNCFLGIEIDFFIFLGLKLFIINKIEMINDINNNFFVIINVFLRFKIDFIYFFIVGLINELVVDVVVRVFKVYFEWFLFVCVVIRVVYVVV